MRHLTKNSKPVFALLLAGAFLLVGTVFSGNVKETTTNNADQYAQDLQSGGISFNPVRTKTPCYN